MNTGPQLFHVGHFGTLPVLFFRMEAPDLPWLDINWLFALIGTEAERRLYVHQVMREEFGDRVQFYGDLDDPMALIHPLALVGVLQAFVASETLRPDAIVELMRLVLEAQTKLATAFCDADGAAYLNTAMERATADEATRRLH